MDYYTKELIAKFILYFCAVLFAVCYFPVFLFAAVLRKISLVFLWPVKHVRLYGKIQKILMK